MENTLVDVSSAIACRQTSSFNRVRAFVVNYIADVDFPHKFYYNGCSSQRANGTYCGKASCEHPRWLNKKMYRFQLQLTDCSPSPPVTVTVFDSVHTLIRMSAEELSTRPPADQLTLVHEVTSRAEMCELYLKVKQDTFSGEFVAVVQSMSIVDMQMDEVLAEIMRTPTRSTSISRSPVEFLTPKEEEYGSGSTSAASSSSRRRAAGSRSAGGSSSERRAAGSHSVKLSNVKTKMQDLNMAVIDLTELDD